MRFTVLLVEKDALVALDLEYMLLGAGLNVLPVNSVAAALDVTVADVDCVLTDTAVGEDDVRPIYDRYASAPVVIYSGVDERMALSDFPNAVFVPKPSPSRDLLWEIVKATNNASQATSKRRAIPKSRRIGREVATAVRTLSLPMLEWQSKVRTLQAVVEAGRAQARTFDAAVTLLSEVNEARSALEKISKELTADALLDSRFVDRSKSLAALHAELQAVVIRAKN
ncbi:MAG: hypothetical protein HY371_05585 [Devosia nanyangense]|nr:hypothetical protein [Devosia nanyangense]